MWPAIAMGAMALGSAIGNYMGNKADAERASEAYDKISGLTQQVNDENTRDIDAYRKMVADAYGNGAGQYSDAVSKFLGSKVYQNEGFTPTGKVEDFMDPAANQRLDAALAGIDRSAAASGSRFSSDYLSRITGAEQAHVSEEFEKAYNKLMQDRQRQLSEWTANSQNNWNNYNARREPLKDAVSIYGTDLNNYMGGMGDAMSAGISNRGANLQSMANAIAGGANAQQGTSGWDLFGGLSGAGLNFLSSYFGGK